MTSFLFTLVLLFSWFNTTNETEKNELSLLFTGKIMVKFSFFSDNKPYCTKYKSSLERV